MDAGAQYNRIGEQYAEANREFFKNEHDPAREFIRDFVNATPGKNLLDIGCGAGDDLVFWGNTLLDCVVGVDPSVTMIREAGANTERLSRVTIRLGDFENTGCPARSMDYVTSRFALHYLRNFDKAYAEVARVLKPGGLFVFSVDHPTADMVEGERFDKEGVKHVRIKLYNGKVVIEFPLHNFGDYFSPKFLNHFDLLKIEEPTAKDREWQEGPNMLLIAARKKK